MAEKTREEVETDFIGLLTQSTYQTIERRRDFAPKFFKLALGWIGFIIVILLLQGFRLLGFQLSNSVVIAALGATTANVLGLLVIVARNVFPPDEADLLRALQKKP